MFHLLIAMSQDTFSLKSIKVSFKTAAAQTGLRYKTVPGTTRLVILFTRTLSIDIDFVDDSKVENNAGENRTLHRGRFRDPTGIYIYIYTYMLRRKMWENRRMYKTAR